MQEIVVTLRNQPGQVHQVATELGDSGINILAVAVIAQGDDADVHMLTSDPERALEVLTKNGRSAVAGAVLFLELAHSPGELARITKILADNGVNITLLYGSGANGPEAKLVLGVDDLDAAKKALLIE